MICLDEPDEFELIRIPGSAGLRCYGHLGVGVVISVKGMLHRGK